MKLVNNDCLQIAITESVVFSDYTADPSRISGVQIKGVYNEVEFIADYIAPFPICDTVGESLVQCGNEFFIKPPLFNMTEKLSDGVYTITVTGLYADNTQISEFACTYIDCETKCRVLESQCLEAMMYHYTLHQSYDCNCNCDKLYTIWEALQHLLNKDNICDKC